MELKRGDLLLHGDLKKAYEVKNLKKAWFWLKTSQDAFYKQYSRHLYRAFSLAEDELLLNLSKSLLNGSYQPSFSTKIYVPKKSGILRPITLLTIEDQIVYQALANIVAEKMYRKRSIKESANKKFFGSIYGGNHSFGFYEDWRKGYRKFQSKFEREFNKGFDYTASFDLTACFDSISYAVLEFHLLGYGLDKEFCSELRRYLTQWSTYENLPNPIYHGHGIPQGPLSSGIIAEAVLHAFDSAIDSPRKVTYFRYVDDIRLLAIDEKSLRTSLIKLDLKSKALGLFPQSSKIDIHKITNIREEIKHIDFSQDDDLITTTLTVDDEKNICSQIMKITQRGEIVSETEFKYLLSKVRPKYGLQDRLIKLLEKNPHLYRSILNSFAKMPKFTDKISENLYNLLKKEQLYCSYQAKFITLLRERISDTHRTNFINFCANKIASDDYKSDPEYRVAVSSVLLHYNRLSFLRIKKLVLSETNWWARAKSFTYVNDTFIGEPSLIDLIDGLARTDSSDAGLIAVEKLLQTEVDLEVSQIRHFNKLVQTVLKKEGKVSRVFVRKCSIADGLEEMFDLKITINWKTVLGDHYSGVHKKLHRWLSYNNSDPSAWVNITDTINDIILNRLMVEDTTVGTAPGVGGKMGSVLNAPTGRLATKYPKFYAAIVHVHNLRLESDLSHPITKKTGKYTRFIAFKELKGIRKMLKEGYEEIWLILFKTL